MAEYCSYLVDYSKPALSPWVNRCLSKVAQHLGWSNVTPYDFRRTFASNMKHIVAADSLQYLMGHRQGSVMVDKRYMAREAVADTTSARFGVDADTSGLARLSVGHGKQSDSSSFSRVDALIAEVETVTQQVIKRFGSIQSGLDLGEVRPCKEQVLLRLTLVFTER
jgi:hypothetical protein